VALHPLIEIELHFKINPKSTTTTTLPRDHSTKLQTQHPKPSNNHHSTKLQIANPTSKINHSKINQNQNQKSSKITNCDRDRDLRAQLAQAEIGANRPPHRDRQAQAEISKPKPVSNRQPPCHHKINREQMRDMENREQRGEHREGKKKEERERKKKKNLNRAGQK
jgi:hypothetical protein